MCRRSHACYFSLSLLPHLIHPQERHYAFQGPALFLQFVSSAGNAGSEGQQRDDRAHTAQRVSGPSYTVSAHVVSNGACRASALAHAHVGKYDGLPSYDGKPSYFHTSCGRTCIPSYTHACTRKARVPFPKNYRTRSLSIAHTCRCTCILQTFAHIRTHACACTRNIGIEIHICA